MGIPNQSSSNVCRHCNQPLAFFRSLLRSEFCSVTHQQDYRKNIETLALDRLKIAAERIRDATRSKIALQSEPVIE